MCGNNRELVVSATGAGEGQSVEEMGPSEILTD
ncbi:uncharacterized protein METZ01_LOCUS417856 [marine metagenome]|uniref:Uncharacterized protein n=1 Tax=marine metagenome TaxID=408172 RepID=A0A382X1P0_9ZZZZ